MQHALQCAHLAERAGAVPTLIVACLLHDVGHLAHDLGEDAAKRGIDDGHEYRAVRILSGLLPEAVLAPIRLHVEAKRWLCWSEPGYWPALSPASQRSLELQGGIFSDEQAEAFMIQPFAADSVWLRRWDDLAKDPNAIMPSFAHFADLARGLVIAQSQAVANH